MPVAAVINRKGGSGKSTLATQLAGCLAARGLQVMLGDVDRQQSSLAWLRRRSVQTLVKCATIDAKAGRSVVQEGCETLAIVRSRHEEPRDEEQQPHEERLQIRLPCAEDERLDRGYGRPFDVVPVAEGAVRISGVHADDEQDHCPATDCRCGEGARDACLHRAHPCSSRSPLVLVPCAFSGAEDRMRCKCLPRLSDCHTETGLSPPDVLANLGFETLQLQD